MSQAVQPTGAGVRTEKLVRRHPHVFDGAAPGAPGARVDLEDMHVQWDRIKAHEKQRGSVLDGIPAAQGALARGQKVLARARRAGLVVGGDLAQTAASELPGGADVAAWTEADVRATERAARDQGPVLGRVLVTTMGNGELSLRTVPSTERESEDR